MIIPVNHKYRIDSDKRQWILQECVEHGWAARLYFPDGLTLIKHSAEALNVTFDDEDWNDFRQVLAPMIRLRTRIEAALEGDSPTYEHFYLDKTVIPIGEWARLDADKLQFRVRYPHKAIDKKTKRPCVYWRPKHFHRHLPEALMCAFVRRVRSSRAEGVEACIRAVREAEGEIMAAMVKIGQRYAIAERKIENPVSSGVPRPV